jgi:hypothetical protein
MRTRIVFGVFALILVSLGIFYFTAPTLRDRLTNYFASFFYVAPDAPPASMITAKKVEEKTFTGTTYDKPQDGTRSITYTLRYPSQKTLVQQMNNELSQMTIPDSYESIHMSVFYKPEAKTLDEAWDTLSTGELKSSLGATPPQKTDTANIAIPGAESTEYTSADENFVVTHFSGYPEWFFVFNILATTQKDLLIPIAETLTVTTAK